MNNNFFFMYENFYLDKFFLFLSLRVILKKILKIKDYKMFKIIYNWKNKFIRLVVFICY